jgi:hypothetical protein
MYSYTPYHESLNVGIIIKNEEVFVDVCDIYIYIYIYINSLRGKEVLKTLL